MKRYKIIIIGIIVITVIVLYNFTPIKNIVNIDNLLLHKESILELVRINYIKYSVFYLIIYIIIITLSIPVATILSILGGFLFGFIPALILIISGTTVGSMNLFLTSRHLFSKKVEAKYSDKMVSFNKELEENGTNYLLSLRLIPLSPYSIISIIAGLSTISWKKFLLTSFIGIIPTAAIYSYIGFTGNITLQSDNLITKEIFIILSLLGILAVLPIIIKKIKKRRTTDLN